MCRPGRSGAVWYAGTAHHCTPLISQHVEPAGVAMSERRTSFGELLRHLRSGAALSQEALAERASLSKRGISDLERGARQAPRLETVRLLANALVLSDADRTA